MSAAAAVLAREPLTQPAWYALYTQAMRERLARDQLRTLGVEAFLPSFMRLSTVRTRRDIVRIETPLFPGYLFARFDPAEDLATVKRARGVSQVVGPGSRPLAISEEIIETMRRACQNPAIVSPAEYTFTAGERVTVASGPFAGMTGTVDRTAGRNRLILRIELLQRACAVELGRAELLRAT